MNKYARITIKTFLWIIACILMLLVLVFVLIKVPAVQDFARKKAVAFLQNKIGTPVEIDKLSLDLPKQLVLEGVYFEDQKGDTLLAGDTLKVDISMLKLLKNQVEINLVDLRGITANVQRTMPDSAFNFDYIINAFMTQQAQPAPPADSTAALTFSVGKINLDRIKVNYRDAVTASDIAFTLGHFDTRITDFNLDNMRYNIPEINLEGLNARVYQLKPVKVKPAANETTPLVAASAAPTLDLKLGILDVSKVKVDYRNDISAINTQVDLGRLLVKMEKTDIKNQDIVISSIALTNTTAALGLGKAAQQGAESTGGTISNEAQKGWTVRVAKLALKNNDIKFDDLSAKKLPRGIDYMHLDIQDLNGDAENIYYSVEEISGKIGNLSMLERSGLDLRRLETNFLYGKNQAFLENLYLQTSHTVIKDELRLTYPSVESLTENPGELGIEANLNGTRIGLRDVLIIMPDLASVDPFKGSPNLVLDINGRASGKVKDLSIPNLEISGLTNTRISASGRLTGLPDMDKAAFNISLHEFRSGSRDLNALVSKGVIPSNIRIPENFRATGNFRGSMENFNANMVVNSTIGSVTAVGGLRGESFSANVGLTNFNAGRLIRQEANIGRITVTAKVNGTGFDPKTMNARFALNAKRAEIKGYSYSDFTANGTIADQKLAVTGNINDPNIKLELDVNASNIQNSYPSVDLAVDVDSANLQALKLYNEDLRFRGKVVANLPSTDPDRLIGTIDAYNLLVAMNGERYPLDSVNVVATANGDQRDLRIRSEVITANITGQYRLTQLAGAFTNEINKYFKIGDGKTVLLTTPHDFTFAAHITNRPILQNFVPALKRMESADISGSLTSTTGALTLAGNIPRVTYMGYNISNLKLNANADSNALKYAINLDKAASASLQLNKTTVEGEARDNELIVDLNIKDIDEKDRYRLSGMFAVSGPQYRFSFNPGGLVLNYEPWAVSQENALEFGPQGILATNFELSRAGQRLSVHSDPQSLNSPLVLRFTDFKIETLTSIVQKDTVLAGGVINGDALISNLNTTPVFTADMNITDFSFMTDTVGNIDLKVNNQTPNTFTADATITGNGNNVHLSGLYYSPPQDNNSFDLDLDINTLNLASIEGFTMGNLTDAGGTIRGNLRIRGTPSAPAVRGELNFNDATFNIAMLNAVYRVDDERISFTSQGIELNDFTLRDSIGNEAVVDGNLLTSNYLDYRFALDVTTDNFRALSSTKKDNDLFYGTVFVSSDLQVTGDMSQPVVDGRVSINDGTNFTVVLPTADPAVQERAGIVEFVDMDDPKSADALTSGIDTVNQTEISGLDVSMNIEVDSNAIFNIIVDEGTGDYLEVQGEAELSAGIDPSGKVSLTGNYELVKGAYEMSYNFIRRRFDIERGSTITWTGEPTEANVNVTAIYVANTAPLDLVDDYLSGTTEAQRNRYKQRLPFEVYLMVKGEMLRPQISFDIGLPEGRNYNVSNEVLENVDTRLTQLRQQPNEMNKQVFSLLLLNRFSSENPFAGGGGGGGVSSFARQSVSRILSDQLNNLAGNIIEGVDINFNLVSSEDYTTGELRNRTDLNVGVSKQLLNDRLKVTIGNNFELEGPRNANQGSSGIAGNVALDYQLTQDGRYMLRAYRKNVTDAVVEGYVVETGVGFIISMDYNRFRELFMRPSPEEKRRRKEEKENRKRKKETQKEMAKTEN
ncbi:MAG TPA: translocation/assembly module TamB domain-containing protein [Sphingobacteriaceae bacterium]